jgi:hypothetical protein
MIVHDSVLVSEHAGRSPGLPPEQLPAWVFEPITAAVRIVRTTRMAAFDKSL